LEQLPRARLESFMVQSARLVGAFSSSAASNSRRASGKRFFLMSALARPTRALVNLGSSWSPVRNISSALSGDTIIVTGPGARRGMPEANDVPTRKT
jgi:hypothetical protein